LPGAIAPRYSLESVDEPFEPKARERLVGELAMLGGLEGPGPRPVVSLESFFEGNDDCASLGGNLSEHPGPAGFYRMLSRIRALPEVQDVLVEVRLVDDGEWPFARGIYVLTSASVAQVTAWLAPLRPRHVREGWSTEGWSAEGAGPPGAPLLGDEMRVVGVWWR
jgi:hypothetical protein